MKKTIFKNYLFNMAYSMMGIILPLITIPYVSRVLFPEGMGQVSYAQNIVSYFTLIASLGIPNYGIREIAKNSEDVKRRSQIFYEIFFINVVSTLLATIAYFGIVLQFDFFEGKLILYCIVGISLILNFFNIDWFYKGLEEFKYITIRSYITKIISIILIFIMVRSQDDINMYALILTLATSSNYIFNAFHARKYLTWKVRKLSVKKHIKPVLYLFATAVAVELYVQLDTTMVGVICGDTYVGYYTNVMKIIRMVAVAITALGGVLLPRLSILYQTKEIERLNKMVEKAVEYIILVSIPCAVGLFCESEIIVNVLFGKAFLPAEVTMRILSILIPILSIGNIFGTQLMVVLNQEKKLTITVIIGAVINIVLNSFLILKYQQNGAAIASVIAEFVVMITQIIFTGKYVKISLNWRLYGKLLLQLVSMAGILIAVNEIVISEMANLIVAITLGIFAYGITGLILKNELINEGILKFLSLIRKE